MAVQPTSAHAKPSGHHAKDKQRFVVSLVAYDSLPGHQSHDILRCSTRMYDAAPVRERNVARQLIDRSTLHWRSWSLGEGPFVERAVTERPLMAQSGRRIQLAE